MDGTAKRRALGRGLGALIPGRYADAPEADSVAPKTVPLVSISTSHLQPRRRFAEEPIDELAASIREKGLLQPLLVRPIDGGYQLIAGERRLRAAQRAGLSEVPVTVRVVDDREALELALIENIQRENLNPIDEARAYRQLSQEFGLTQDEVAKRVGKDRSTIANTLRLLSLPDTIQRDLENGILSAGHARALAGVPSDEDRIAMAKEIAAKRLNVRQTEQMAKARAAKAPDPNQRAAEEQLTEVLGTRVRLAHRRDGSGRIEIHYYSLDGLNGLLDRLSRS